MGESNPVLAIAVVGDRAPDKAITNIAATSAPRRRATAKLILRIRNTSGSEIE
jgi:hypothetical protein